MAVLPLLLAGPIVRRVTPLSVSVWVAVQQASQIKLEIWNKAIDAGVGAGTATIADAPLHTATSNTIRIGSKLHIAVVTITVPPAPAAPLMPGQLHSYNLSFDGTADLKSLGLLADRLPTTTDPAPRLALGYQAGFLPTFVLPPVLMERTMIAHGSCRKAHGPGKDSLAALDHVIRQSVANAEPEQRPHALFLTGDQIYADEVPTVLLPSINALGRTLIGKPENLSAKKADGTTAPFEATLTLFPATRRERIVQKNAKFSSEAASSHLLSFSEFAATYLMYWNNEVWDDELFNDTALRARVNYLDTWDTDPLTPTEVQLAPLDADEQKKFDDETPEQKQKRIDQKKEKVKKQYKGQLRHVITFRAQLPHVRRVLANVPVYMIFDDHEVTDDWYLTKDWRDKVLTAPLGVTILRNGLMAYALFQDWGNDPAQYTAAPKQALLTDLQGIFPDAAAAGPVQAVADAIDVKFGFDLPTESTPPVTWHYSAPCSATTVYVLDTRTRRTYETRYSPPGLLSDSALADQLPVAVPPGPFVMVVSPAPVLGLGVMEELVQPVVVRFAAYKPDPEAWAFAPVTFEKFLDRLQPFKRVVILSGDVHFSLSAYLDYWKKGSATPTRIVQFVSSALKNQQRNGQQYLNCGFMQQFLGSAFRPLERLGWLSRTGLTATNTANTTNSPALRVRLRREPVLLPSVGWPEDTTVNLPADWSWRLDMIFDARLDTGAPGSRPQKIRPIVISPDVVTTSGDSGPGFQKVLARHLDLFLKGGSRRVMWETNVGIVRVAVDALSKLTVFHDLWFWLTDDEINDDPDVYISFGTPLEPTGDAAPVIPRP
jgi:hypothetical protein